MVLTQVNQMRQTKTTPPGRRRPTLLPLINFLVGVADVGRLNGTDPFTFNQLSLSSLMLGTNEITVVSKPNSFSSPMQCDSVSITPDPGKATYNSSAKKWSLRGIMLAKIDQSR
ncbi:hypothetical protein CDAR_320061 [Caerostris darwini]|uniref:Uncharacterized protein n=1 Tax=Caerostris darwini TaxID=1538125 RepID=A0AAV4SV19_9ARAC|nr:hypothetical protein CDAR_320061 [Caerostris darwini]